MKPKKIKANVALLVMFKEHNMKELLIIFLIVFFTPLITMGETSDAIEPWELISNKTYVGQTKADLEAVLGDPLETGVWGHDNYVQMVYEQTWNNRTFKVTYLLQNNLVQGLELHDIEPDSAPLININSDCMFLADMGKTCTEIFNSMGPPKSYTYTPDFFESINYGKVKYNNISYHNVTYSLEKDVICGIGYTGSKIMPFAIAQAYVYWLADNISTLFHEPFWLYEEVITPLNSSKVDSLEYNWRLKYFYIDETYYFWSLMNAINDHPSTSFYLFFWKHAAKGPLMQKETRIFAEHVRELIATDLNDKTITSVYGGAFHKLYDLTK